MTVALPAVVKMRDRRNAGHTGEGVWACGFARWCALSSPDCILDVERKGWQHRLLDTPTTLPSPSQSSRELDCRSEQPADQRREPECERSPESHAYGAA